MKAKPIVYIVESGAETFDQLRHHSLLSQHIDIERFETPEAFLQRYDADRPGCLVLDMHVAGYNGHEVIRRLNERMFSLPSIVLIESGDVITAADMLKAGATEFVEKPANLDVLLERVHDSIKRSAAAVMREDQDESESIGPIGNVMIDQGTLSVEQVEAILAYQAHHNDKAFGELAHEMFDIDPLDIWRARAVQLLPLLKVVNLNEVEPTKDALGAIDSGEAATFWVLPLSIEGDHLIIATTANRLGEAMMKCHAIFKHAPIKFVLAAPLKLYHAIEKHYGTAPMSHSEFGGVGDLQAEAPARALRVDKEDDAGKVEVLCARCDEHFKVAPGLVGKRVGCPGCGEPVHAVRPEDKSEPLTLPGSADPGFDPELSLEALTFGDVSAGDLSMKFACEVCEGHIRVPGSMVGKRVFCPHCQYATTVPTSASNRRVLSVDHGRKRPA